MVKIRELLRLRFEEKLPHWKIAQNLRVSKHTVYRLLKRAEEIGITWPLPPELTDKDLQKRIKQKHPTRLPEPDWNYIWKESRKKGVTLKLLWMEYRQEHPDGYSYQRFCALNRRYKNQLQPVMRFEYKAGEKMFVDWAGLTASYIEPETGEIREAQIFVSTLGASSYNYCWAFPNQQTPSWIEGHERAFEFYEGVTEYVVPDNTKTAVTKPHYYDPDLNRTYLEFSRHYNFIIMPARPEHPKDKAMVEAGVKFIENWVLAPVRKKTFFGLEELNDALQEKLEECNRWPMKVLKQSRLELFEELEREVLGDLPVHPFEFGDWKDCRVHLDYHIEVDRHFYSVPFDLIGEEVGVKISPRLIQISHQNTSVVKHIRSYGKKRYITVDEHMPSAHLRYKQRLNPDRILSWANSIGMETVELIKGMFSRHKFPEHCYRPYLGMKSLAKRYGNDKLEEAVGILRPTSRYVSYKRLKRVIELKLQESQERIPIPTHIFKNENLRGPQYYQ